MVESITTLSLKPIHPFAARMAPAIIWSELPPLDARGAQRALRVLDPMTGSGTTLATARLRGHNALGFDTDPLAVLIAQAWSADVEPDRLVALASRVARSAREQARCLPLSKAYPIGADEETREFVRYWFDSTARRHLAALASVIRAQRDDDLQSLLWCAFSRLIIVKSAGASLAMDVAHSRPHKVYDLAPVRPLAVTGGRSWFERAASVIAQRAPFVGETRGIGPKATVRQADARRLPLSDCSIDMVITSPPYLNAIDYLRGHKFSLIWMGHTISELRAIRASNVGTEVSAVAEASSHIDEAVAVMGEINRLSSRNVGMLRRYVIDMDLAICEMSRVLVPNGRVVLVVGDSSIRGVLVQNSRAIEHLASHHGLVTTSNRRRPLPSGSRYLPPPGADGVGKQLETRMRDEVILSFRKAG